ncbi:MAG: DNA polymerase III subunit delta, partial [Eubacterium sp.]|nr:DNA polymerase III subunit delta [Eubacterium sp.]
WYRDIIVLKVTGNPDKILFKDQYSVISNQAKYLSFNELEDKAKAVSNAKVRLRANARFDDIMRLLILTLKEI